MEVSGYPHYENVASNILAFYFNPSAEHGLKDLLVSAFLKMAGRQDLSLPSRVKVHREFDTGAGRLDLVIESDAFLIAIENKIFHWLANDLEQYASATKDKANGKAEIRVVLGLKTVPAKQLKGGFVSFTYAQLWQQVQVLLGRYIQNANPKWVTYLMDFMETTTNLAGSNMELSKTDRFFIEQREVVDKLFTEHRAFLERLKQRLQPLCDLVSQTPESARCASVWVCDEFSCVVLDFVFDKTYKIACDVGITPHGWKMTLFNRPPAEHIEYLRKLASQPSLADKVNKFPQENKRYVIQKWDLDTDYERLCSDLRSWIKLIVEASETLALQNASTKLEVPPPPVS